MTQAKDVLDFSSASFTHRRTSALGSFADRQLFCWECRNRTPLPNPKTFPTPPEYAQFWRMTHKPSSPLALSDHSLAHPGRHDGWTPARQATFLRALASTQSVAKAARAAGMSRQSAYGLRARLKGEPFDLAWHAAMRCRFDALAEAAMERALNGVEVPHFHKGELIHTSRRFDERLTVALLAMRDRL
ncbi:MAG: hypothetical protein V2J51_04355, partial [Erythrobacter sp.]|nr:hypothetical protein [Erythrobacter sp.]